MTDPDVEAIQMMMNALTRFINTSGLKDRDPSAYYFIKDRVREIANYDPESHNVREG